MHLFSFPNGKEEKAVFQALTFTHILTKKNLSLKFTHKCPKRDKKLVSLHAEKR